MDSTGGDGDTGGDGSTGGDGGSGGDGGTGSAKRNLGGFLLVIGTIMVSCLSNMV